MLRNERLEAVLPVLGLDALIDQGIAVDAVGEGLVGVIDERDAAGHAGPEVVADGAEDDGDTAGHVLAAVRPTALDHRVGAGIAHGEALARLAGGEQLARRGAVKHRVADDGVLVADQRRRCQRADDDDATRQSLADIVVGVAEHLQLHPLHGEGAERLTGGAAQTHGDVAGLEPSHAEAAGDHR